MRTRAPEGVSTRQWNALTPFTQRVYLATYQIPKGQTRSYQWVAQKSGHPQALRAVGNALSRNPFMPIVPCHRVICSDGSLGGYALGPKKKLSLLRQEGWNPEA